MANQGQFQKGGIPWNRGIETGIPGGRLCKEGCTCGRHYKSLETRQRLRAAMTGVSRGLGVRKSETTKQRMRKPKTESHRQNMSKARTGVLLSAKHIQKLREVHKQQWQDPEYVSKQMRSRGISPNRIERILEEKLKIFGFSFVGDGQLIVAGKCPDFWNGETKLIELYGDYWHQGQDPQDRIALFKAVGYDCLVIWEHELKSFEKVLERVLHFIG